MTRFRMVAPIAVLALMLTACPASTTSNSPGASGGAGSSGGASGATIEVTSLWGGAEAEAFQAVLDAFTEETGINVTYTSQRDEYSTVLSNRIEQGDPPDVAIIPGIGFLRSFAKDDLLIPLADLGLDTSALADAYAPNLSDMGVSVGTVDDVPLAIMVKLNSKSTIWYDPSRFSDNGWETPTDWDGLTALTDQIKADGATPWALGAADGWTLTDWFESIYLRQAGEEAYDTLFSADGDWTDQSVKDAIATMTEILNDDNVAGGIDGALATAFVDGIGLVFSTDPTAEMYYEGGFVGGIATGDVNDALVPGETIDFFDFPEIDGSGSKITVGGDVMAAFTNEPGVAEFMQYLASADAGTAWVAGGTIISPMAGVESSDYPEAVQKEATQIVESDLARFDGSDLLPGGPDLGTVLQTAIQDPSAVDGALSDFQTQVDDAWAELNG
jgi:ABC-type glycerol-3-phosphate transport system substrate-binding protein